MRAKMSHQGDAPAVQVTDDNNNDEMRARRRLAILHPLVNRFWMILRSLATEHNAPHNVPPLESVAMWKILQDLLSQYTRALVYEESTSSSSSAASASSWQPSQIQLQSMLWVYCLQPCVATLQIMAKIRADRVPCPKATHADLVLDAHCRKVWIAAVQNVQTILQLYPKVMNDSSSSSISMRVQTVEVLVTSLSTIIVDTTNYDSSRNSDNHTTLKTATLEHDTEILQLYYTVLSQVWRSNVGWKQNSIKPVLHVTFREFGQALLGHWPHTALVARVVETCLETISSITNQQHGTQKKLPDQTMEQALDCLIIWVLHLPYPNLWQRLFPGTFHALFRAVMTHRDRRTVVLAQRSLTALVELCRNVSMEEEQEPKEDELTVTKTQHWHAPNNNENSSSNSAIDGTLQTSRLVATIQSWKLTTIPEGSNVANKEKSADSKTELGKEKNDMTSTLFWTRVGQNLAMPLQRLLQQCGNHTASEFMQCETLRLAAILQVWQRHLSLVEKDHDLWGKMQETILDTSVRLGQSASNGQSRVVQQHAQIVLQGGNARDRLPSDRILHRVHALWDDVAALASGQQWMEWSIRLHLLQSYLVYLDRRDLSRFLRNDDRVFQSWCQWWTVDWHILNIRWQDCRSGHMTRLSLPWKYMDRERLELLKRFVSTIGQTIASQSTAVLVDDLVSRSQNLVLIGKEENAENIPEAIAMLEVSGLLLSTIDSSNRKGTKALEALTRSSLPSVLDLLLRTCRHGVKTLPYKVKHLAGLDTSLLQWLASLYRTSGLESKQKIQSTCLFPVLSRSICSEWTIVKNAATLTLQAMSTYQSNCDFSLDTLIIESLESLLGTSLLRIRTEQQRDELREIILTTSAILRHGRRAFAKEPFQMVLAQAKEVLLVAMNRFDRWAVNAAQDEELSLAYIGLFRSIVLCLQSAVDVMSTPEAITDEPPKKGNLVEFDWSTLLDEFLVESKFDVNDTSQGAGGNTDSENRASVSLVSKEHTDLVARVVSIATYLLSHTSLLLQSEACGLLSSCFAHLFTISKLPLHVSPDEELNGTKNAILRHIADCWPSLVARAKATVELLRPQSMSASLLLVQCSNPTDSVNHGHARVLLSRFFDLVVAMVEASDDFMCSRIREAVWPLVDRVLTDAVRYSTTAVDQKAELDSQYMVWEAALSCLSHIFRHRPVGVPLGGLIPSVGNRIFPLLESCLAPQAVVTIKSLILIDCDVLLRPLLDISNTPIPQSPFRVSCASKRQAVSLRNYKSRSKLLAQELLQFIDKQPEQPIE